MDTGAMIGKQNQIRNSPISITLASSPYTVPANISEVNVNTAGGNVRVNLPSDARAIKVNKVSSDGYMVTLYVNGSRIGEVIGERSSITAESGQITKDEPWFPFDVCLGIAGISGDGGEVVAKNKYGKCPSSSWKGTAGTDVSSVVSALMTALASGGRLYAGKGEFLCKGVVIPSGITFDATGKTTFKLPNSANTDLFSMAADQNLATLMNLRLDGNKANNASGNCLNCAGTSGHASWGNRIRDLTVVNAPESGIKLSYPDSTIIDGVFCEDCGYAGINIVNGGKVHVHDYISEGNLYGLYNSAVDCTIDQFQDWRSAYALVDNNAYNSYSNIFAFSDQASWIGLVMTSGSYRSKWSNIQLIGYGTGVKGVRIDGYYVLMNNVSLWGYSGGASKMTVGVDVSESSYLDRL